mgnify:CR=1 FL=1
MLKQTKNLIDAYGAQVINGTITDAELVKLMDTRSFPKSEGYVDPNKPISENNHSQTDAINDFVLAIAPQLKPEILHQLTARMLVLGKDHGANTFMRNSTLEKAFLAYEMSRFPRFAEQFFIPAEKHKDSPEQQARLRMQVAFPGKNDIPNLKQVILKPIIDLYSQKNITTHYRNAIYSERNGRHHILNVSSSKFPNLDAHLKGLKGDRLKSQILLDFQQELLAAKTHDEVDALVENFSVKDEYKTLAAAQGLITLLFHRPTSSLKAFKEMVEERKQDISAELSCKLDRP